MSNISGANAVLTGTVTANGNVNTTNVNCTANVACQNISSTSITTSNANITGVLSLTAPTDPLIQFTNNGTNLSINSSDLQDIINVSSVYATKNEVTTDFATKNELTTGLNQKVSLSGTNILTGSNTFNASLTIKPTTQNTTFGRIINAGIAIRSPYDNGDGLFLGCDTTRNNGSSILQSYWDSAIENATLPAPISINPHLGTAYFNQFPSNYNDTTRAIIANGTIQCTTLEIGTTTINQQQLIDLLAPRQPLHLAVVYTSASLTSNVIYLTCSCKNFDTAFLDNDDYVFVSAGCKVEGYNGQNYAGEMLYSYDNTTGYTPSRHTIVGPNRAASYRVYFNNVEVVFSPIS